MSRNLSKLLFKLFATIAATSLFVSGFANSGGRPAHALGLFAGTQGIQPLAANGSSFHYYASGKRIDLTPSVKWVSVKFADTSPTARAEALKSLGAPLSPTAQTRPLPDAQWALVPVAAGTTQAALLQGINAMRLIPSRFTEVNPVFQAGKDEMAVTDEFIASFDPAESQTQIDAANANYGVQIVQPLVGQPNTFVLKVSADSHMDALAMSNLYQDSGAALAAAPNFVRMTPTSNTAQGTKAAPLTLTSYPNDALYHDQWSLNNANQYSGMTLGVDIRAPAAWSVTTGSPTVVIAVLDSGVELSQEDLSAVGKLVPGCDETATVVFPCVTANGTHGGPCLAPCANFDDARGTAMAGIAAASTNNGLGIAGVCPLCPIMPVRIGNSSSGVWTTTDAWLVDGINWASNNGASVIVGGWQLAAPSSAVTAAIASVATSGRGGKGTVVVFAAGDGNTSVSYPANLSNVISVGALNMCNARKQPFLDFCDNYETSWGSNFGPQLDLLAPGINLDITDRMGTAGYNNGCSIPPGNYNICFGGTAGAAAIVAGVAGLLLSVNPALTASDVTSVLEQTAVDINTPGFDNDTGYGRVNAYNAVTALQTTVFVHGSSQGSFWVSPAQTGRAVYPGLMNGPLEVRSGTNLFASQRVLKGPNNSFNEVMGYPNNQLTNHYWFPWYDDINMTTWVLVGNPSATATAHVSITIAGNLQGTYSIGPFDRITPTFPNVMNGPVEVSSDINVFTSERTMKGPNNSFNEVMGFSANQLTNEYWFPWYDDINMTTWVLVGNPSTTATAHVSITIAGNLQGSYSIGPFDRITPTFPNVVQGPVKVSSDIPVFTSERTVKGPFGMFNEVMGFPNSQFTNDYWFPWYDDVNMTTWVLVGNPSTSATAHVTIKIGGAPVGTYTIAPFSNVTPTFPGVVSGPVEVSSDINVFTSERVLQWPNNSFNEYMGFPASQLTTDWWFPWYDDVNMFSSVMIGVP